MRACSGCDLVDTYCFLVAGILKLGGLECALPHLCSSMAAILLHFHKFTRNLPCNTQLLPGEFMCLSSMDPQHLRCSD